MSSDADAAAAVPGVAPAGVPAGGGPPPVPAAAGAAGGVAGRPPAAPAVVPVPLAGAPAGAGGPLVPPVAQPGPSDKTYRVLFEGLPAVDPQWATAEGLLGGVATRGHDQISTAAVAAGQYATKWGYALFTLVNGEPSTRVLVTTHRTNRGSCTSRRQTCSPG